MLVDSGSSISLIQESVATAFSRTIEKSPKGLQLISAEGKEIPVLGCITLPLRLGKLKVNHNFVAVHSLITPVILGVDFLQKNNLVLDFTSTPVSITPKTVNEWEALPKSMKPLIDTFKKTRICVMTNQQVKLLIIAQFHSLVRQLYPLMMFLIVLINYCWQCWSNTKIYSVLHQAILN